MSHIREQVRNAKTAGAMFNLALSMKDQQEAHILLLEYATVIVQTHAANGERITPNEAIEIARENFAMYARKYYGDAEVKKIRELYGDPEPRAEKSS